MDSIEQALVVVATVLLLGVALAAIVLGAAYTLAAVL